MATAKENAHAALLASLVADSLALGPHWIYDTMVIERRFGKVEELAAPGIDSYHKNRGLGDFTHYGDQTMTLLESVASKSAFDLDAFFADWQALFADYDGYVDGATRNTLSRIEFGEGPDGSGSNSHDLAGAARIAPLVAAYPEDTDALVSAARAQTKMTHNTPAIIDAAEFFARSAQLAAAGSTPIDAMKQAAQVMNIDEINEWLEMGLDMAGIDTTEAIAELGQSCSIGGAFPAVIQIIASHPSDLATALSANAAAGGDSAARGLLVGLVLGASLGEQAIPEKWLKTMNKVGRAKELLGKM